MGNLNIENWNHAHNEYFSFKKAFFNKECVAEADQCVIVINLWMYNKICNHWIVKIF